MYKAFSLALAFAMPGLAVAGTATDLPTAQIAGTSADKAIELVRSAPQVQAQQDGLVITFGWTRATTPSMKASAAYVTIQNTNDADDVLTGASSPVAAMVELHGMRMNNDVMEMFPVEGGITLPAGEEMKLSPGGTHIMLMGLTQQIKVGEVVPITLTFQNAKPITFDLGVMPLNHVE